RRRKGVGVGVLDDGGLGQGTPPMFAITIAIAAAGRTCWPRKHDFPDNSGVLGQRYGNDRHAHNWCAPFLKRQTNGKVVPLLSSRFCFRATLRATPSTRFGSVCFCRRRRHATSSTNLITKRSKYCKSQRFEKGRPAWASNRCS